MSNEREAFEAAWEEFQDKDLTSSNRIQAHAWFLKGYRSASQSADDEFKNFHRLLCERFGYSHDEKDWKRDQLSLIEWIAARQSAGATGEEPVGTLSIHRFRKIDSMVNHDFEYYGSLPDGTYRVYVAPIGDNGVKASHDVIWPEPGDTDTVSFDAQPAESKRVELTDEEIGHLRLIVSFCETLSSIERGSYADDALRALRLFLARASAKGA